MHASAVLDSRYQILDVIGQGACAVVHRARDTRDGRLVAVKTLAEGRVHSPAAVQRLVHEAEVMARVQHPHALPVLDFGWFADGRPWFATELLQGASLDTFTADGPMAPLVVVRLLRQICDVLASTHGEGLVHCDVKPAHVWIQAVWDGPRGPMPIARLIDFGLTLSLDDLNAGRRPPAGSPDYIAPEVVLGRPVDGRADLFALGMVAYEALTGAAPYAAQTSARRALLDRLSGQITPLVYRVPGLDPELALLVESLLSRAPEDRPASATALDEHLACIEARLVQRRPSVRLSHLPPPPVRRARPALALVH